MLNLYFSVNGILYDVTYVDKVLSMSNALEDTIFLVLVISALTAIEWLAWVKQKI